MVRRPDQLARGGRRGESGRSSSSTPAWTCNVQYQSWGDYKTKFEATLAGRQRADVVEFGNTETPKYTAAGALRTTLDQSGASPNSGTWLSGPRRRRCTYNGKPLRRAVLRRRPRRHLPHRPVQGGRHHEARPKIARPSSMAARPEADEEVRRKDRDVLGASTSPASYWYASMSFVYDYGGQIARLRTAVAGSAELAAGARRPRPHGEDGRSELSRANKTGDEAHPQQALVFAKGKVGSFIGNGWEWPYALDTKVGNPRLAEQDRRLPDAEPHARASTCRRSSAARTSPSRSRASRRRSRPTGSRPSRARQLTMTLIAQAA